MRARVFLLALSLAFAGLVVAPLAGAHNPIQKKGGGSGGGGGVTIGAGDGEWYRLDGANQPITSDVGAFCVENAAGNLVMAAEGAVDCSVGMSGYQLYMGDVEGAIDATWFPGLGVFDTGQTTLIGVDNAGTGQSLEMRGVKTGAAGNNATAVWIEGDTDSDGDAIYLEGAATGANGQGVVIGAYCAGNNDCLYLYSDDDATVFGETNVTIQSGATANADGINITGTAVANVASAEGVVISGTQTGASEVTIGVRASAACTSANSTSCMTLDSTKDIAVTATEGLRLASGSEDLYLNPGATGEVAIASGDDLVCDVDGTCDLGTAAGKFDDVWALWFRNDYSAVGHNMRITTDANGAGEFGPVVGSTAVAGAQTDFAIAADVDGTPSYYMRFGNATGGIIQDVVMVPGTDNIIDLGSSGFTYRTLYVNGIDDTDGSVTVGPAAGSFNLNLQSSNDTTLQKNGSGRITFGAANTSIAGVNLRLNTGLDLVAQSDASSELGASGTEFLRAWIQEIDDNDGTVTIAAGVDITGGSDLLLDGLNGGAGGDLIMQTGNSSIHGETAADDPIGSIYSGIVRTDALGTETIGMQNSAPTCDVNSVGIMYMNVTGTASALCVCLRTGAATFANTLVVAGGGGTC